MANKIKVGVVQQPCNSNKEDNLNLSISYIKQAANLNCHLLVLPELHLGPYFCQHENPDNFDLAESIPGHTTQALCQTAKETGMVIVASLFEKRAPGLYHNTAVVFDRDGSIAGKYRKMHIPDDPGYYEKFYFTPGDLGFKPITTSIGTLGVLVCWDQWFPEAARLMSLAGANVLIFPTAIGWDPYDADDEKKRQLDAWVTIQKSHAIANGIPVISCNRIGYEISPENKQCGIQFWGNSFITGPQGEILTSADHEEQKLLISSIDKSNNEKTRRIWPFFRDRRIEEYGDLTKRYILETTLDD